VPQIFLSAADVEVDPVRRRVPSSTDEVRLAGREAMVLDGRPREMALRYLLPVQVTQVPDRKNAIGVEDSATEMALRRDLRACQTTPGDCDVVTTPGDCDVMKSPGD